MNNLYRVIYSGNTPVKNKPKKSGSTTLYTLSYGTKVNGYAEKGGFIKINQNLEQWVEVQHLQYVQNNDAVTNKAKATAAASARASADLVRVYDNPGQRLSSSRYYSGSRADASSAGENMLIANRLFGSPPQFTNKVDPVYGSTGTGRKYAETIAINPCIVSICPGEVQYLTKMADEKKQGVLRSLINDSSLGRGDGSKVREALEANGGGMFYKFRSAYSDYMKVVNLLCRITAIYMGVGDDRYLGKGKTYSKYDWGDFNKGTSFYSSSGGRVKDFINEALNNIIGTNQYMHFYASALTVAEDMSTSTRSSSIEELFNSKFSEGIKDLNFLTGGVTNADGILGGAADDIDKVLEDFGDTNGFMGSLLRKGKGYLDGAKLLFPQMVDDVTYGKSLDVTCRFISPYGDPESRYLYTIVPLCFLLAFVLPQQYKSEPDMYTYPFLCRVFCKSEFSSDMAIISNLRITRGGQEDLSWTVDGGANEIEVTFQVTPLYTKLISGTTAHPFLFLANAGLQEYLGTLCGVNMKKNTIDIQTDTFAKLFTSAPSDILPNAYRGLFDSYLANAIRNIVTMP